MKTVLVITFLLISVGVFAQKITPELQSLIDTENAFARLSKEKNTKDAFLEYMTDSTVLVEGGSLVKGKSSWLKREQNNALLFWWPEFVGIAASGDLGFSTGPWQWSQSKTAEPQAQGYYATVWQKTKFGGWKMAIDLGISMPTPAKAVKSIKTSRIVAPKKTVPYSEAKELFMAFDKGYSAKLNVDSSDLDQQYFAPDALLERKGSAPAYFPFTSLLKEKRKVVFEQTGGDLASSQDLGYTYGTAKVIQSDKTRNLCYMRVWKHDGRSWKIVLDVIGGNE
jgi:ketosteroid isomerase-like protein